MKAYVAWDARSQSFGVWTERTVTVERDGDRAQEVRSGFVITGCATAHEAEEEGRKAGFLRRAA